MADADDAEYKPIFSKERDPNIVIDHYKGCWWNPLLELNADPATRATHPYKCALGCGKTWTAKGVNNTKMCGHVIGDDHGRRAGAKVCCAGLRLRNA